MRNIVIGNWKMNPTKVSDAKKIIEGGKKLTAKLNLDIVICPPEPFLFLLSNQKKLLSGAQNVSFEKEGAFTGEVSATQLRSMGVSYVIVGHSERRKLGETSEIVAKKAIALLKTNISPVICIGEKDRKQDGEHWQEIKWQLFDSLSGISKKLIEKCVIAYEPLWAIGKESKGVMESHDIAESAIFIRKIIAEMHGTKVAEKVRIIYGGSIDTKNAKEIAVLGGVSGCLVGRESLKPINFAKIAEAFSRKKK